MENSVLGLLYRQMEEDRVEFIRALSSGVAKDYAEYRELCGKIDGLARAQLRLDEMKVRLKEQDE